MSFSLQHLELKEIREQISEAETVILCESGESSVCVRPDLSTTAQFSHAKGGN